MKLKTLLNIRTVSAMTARSRSSIYRDVRAGKFPPPLQIGPHSVAFRLDDIESWIASRPVAGGGGRS